MEATGTFPAETFASGKLPDWQTFSRALLDATRDAVAVTDQRGRIIFANGVARQTPLSLRIGEALSELRPELWPHVERTLKEGGYQTGIAVQCAKASYLAKVSPVLWNSTLIGALCILESSSELEKITRRMLSYQQLSLELDAIINSSSDGLWICNEEGVVIRVNPASERFNGIRAEEVVGRGMRDLLAEGLIDRSATLEVLKTKSVTNMLQQTREGRKLMVTGNPVFDGQGNLSRVVINERDITEIDRLRRKLEQQEAISDRFREEMLQMQLAETEARRIIARSPPMMKVLRQTLRVASVDSNVLILGESGVGKGLVADLIHKHSARAGRPMIKINCGAIPESLMESELFGYEKGAFTGALKSGKPGQVELADGGILFLDEIAELPLSSQVKLLRFLEDGCATRIGGTTSRKVDVRILAATNRDLESMLEQRLFRRDLYYRLNVIPISIPPLAERREDILPLIQHFLDHFGARWGGGTGKTLSRAALDALLAYSYPGNVRELMNLCERLVVMSEGERIDLEDLPAHVAGSSANCSPLRELFSPGKTLNEMVEAYERAILEEARKKHGTQQAMAAALGVNQSTIARKLKKHGIEPGDKPS